ITDSGTGDLARPLFLQFGGEVSPGEAFAHMVPNQASAAALLKGADGLFEMIAPAEISDWSGEGTLASLSLTDGRALSAPLIIAADGAQSGLRNRAGIGTIGHDYGQT